MSDDHNRRAQQRLAQEYRELDDPVVQAQLLLDHFCERKLEQRAARLRRIERPGVVCAEAGIYDPFARVADETVGWGKF